LEIVLVFAFTADLYANFGVNLLWR